MAIVVVDSFDHYVTADMVKGKWHILGNGSISAGNGRNGTAALAYGQSSTIKFLLSAYSTLTVGFAFKVPSGTSTIFYLGDNVRQHLLIRRIGDGSITVSRGEALISNIGDPTGAVLLGSSVSGLTVADTWHHIQVKATIDDSSGEVEVRIDGTTVISISGVDTKANASGASSTITAIGFSNYPAGSASYVDDLVITDTSGSVNTGFLGDCVVECSFASTGNGANADSTPSTGSDRGEMVNESASNGDTDYNELATVGDKDTYNFGNLSSSGVVRGFQIVTTARKTDTGKRAIQHVTRPLSTDYDSGSDITLSIDYTMQITVSDVNPETAVAPTVSEINATEFGLKVTV